MKECIIHRNIAIPADNQSAIISEPGEGSFDLSMGALKPASNVRVKTSQ